MPREGTRSQTGNSRPRIFHAIDTAPTIFRKKAAKPAASSSLKSKLTPKSAAEKQAGKNGKGAGAGSGEAGVLDRVRSAVGLAPREPAKVVKKGGVKRAVQKVCFSPSCLEDGDGTGRGDGMGLTVCRLGPRPSLTTRILRRRR
ncbi:hypothetical protein IMZ48_17710 [Candidatus Bathyarchaeota archaeon]|nr:hypothetical protein [Candidatus Bathyarchaeota archaeon]